MPLQTKIHLFAFLFCPAQNLLFSIFILFCILFFYMALLQNNFLHNFQPLFFSSHTLHKYIKQTFFVQVNTFHKHTEDQLHSTTNGCNNNAVGQGLWCRPHGDHVQRVYTNQGIFLEAISRAWTCIARAACIWQCHIKYCLVWQLYKILAVICNFRNNLIYGLHPMLKSIGKTE